MLFVRAIPFSVASSDSLFNFLIFASKIAILSSNLVYQSNNNSSEKEKGIRDFIYIYIYIYIYFTGHVCKSIRKYNNLGDTKFKTGSMMEMHTHTYMYMYTMFNTYLYSPQQVQHVASLVA